MARPWTTVEWAWWTARPSDPAAGYRGWRSVEPTAYPSGMVQTTPASCGRAAVPRGILSQRREGRRIGTVWRTWCTTRLMSDTRPDPCAWRLTITLMEGKGDVVKKS